MELHSLGWNEHFAATFASFGLAGLQPGRVILQYNHIYTVATVAGELLAQCSGRLRHQALTSKLPVTGDWVALQTSGGDDLALIHAVLPRRSGFSRQAPGRATRRQFMAANLDTAFLMVGLDNDFSPRRVERYLAAAWESGADPVVVLNKLDLCPDASARIAQIQTVADSAAVHAISALHGIGLEALGPYCAPGHTIALLGSSGVGKSTLINRLLGTEALPTQPVRPHDSRGQHTTTRRELLFLPSGGMVIDTPGLRELQLWDGNEGVQRAFDEIETLGRGCRFRDCRHEDEPGCAVRAAVDSGELDPARLANLHKLQKEMEWSERRQDASAALTEKKRWKTIHKAVNRLQRDSPKHRRD